MGTRDTIKAAIEHANTDHPGELGWAIANELERNGVTVNGDFMAEAITQVQGGDELTTDELVDALTEIVNTDQT